MSRVARRQVSVHKGVGGEVLHPAGNLVAEPVFRGHVKGCSVGCVFRQAALELAVLAVGQHQHLGPAARHHADERNEVLVSFHLRHEERLFEQVHLRGLGRCSGLIAVLSL